MTVEGGWVVIAVGLGAWEACCLLGAAASFL